MFAEKVRGFLSRFRGNVKQGQGFPYSFIKSLYVVARNVEPPLPDLVCRVLWIVVKLVRGWYYWIKAKMWVAPLYRGICVSIGRPFSAGTFVPFVEGYGRVTFGDGAILYGKQNFIFASISSQIPTITIGNGVRIGHNVLFDIAGNLSIGDHCRIAGGVMIQDCSGHSLVAEARLAGVAPTEKDIRSITIGRNVWIGTGAYILPGADIGDNCVIGANALVSKKIPENSLVYAVGAKVVGIRDISKVI
jgi:acetyltransferase-like isoleucine patch superfamily enzyme